jgi:hypothetical protein
VFMGRSPGRWPGQPLAAAGSGLPGSLAGYTQPPCENFRALRNHCGHPWGSLLSIGRVDLAR